MKKIIKISLILQNRIIIPGERIFVYKILYWALAPGALTVALKYSTLKWKTSDDNVHLIYRKKNIKSFTFGF